MTDYPSVQQSPRSCISDLKFTADMNVLDNLLSRHAANYRPNLLLWGKIRPRSKHCEGQRFVDLPILVCSIGVHQ